VDPHSRYGGAGGQKNFLPLPKNKPRFLIHPDPSQVFFLEKNIKIIELFREV
jgi:hypothetical protein